MDKEWLRTIMKTLEDSTYDLELVSDDEDFHATAEEIRKALNKISEKTGIKIGSRNLYSEL